MKRLIEEVLVQVLAEILMEVLRWAWECLQLVPWC